jgi:hypothetical protein
MNVYYPRWNPASIASHAISTVEADVTSEGLITIAFLGGEGWGSPSWQARPASSTA